MLLLSTTDALQKDNAVRQLNYNKQKKAWCESQRASLTAFKIPDRSWKTSETSYTEHRLQITSDINLEKQILKDFRDLISWIKTLEILQIQNLEHKPSMSSET